MPTIGVRIKRAREAMGLTQEDLGKRVGRSRVAVAEWEADKKLPRRTLIPKLSETLNLPESALLPHGAGGVSIAPAPQTITITQIQWSDVPLIARGLKPMSAEQVLIDNNLPETIYIDETRLRVEDDSMSPTYNPGDIIRYTQTVVPYDGCQVVAWIEGDDEGVLRNYRQRGPNAFDLWPNNPEFDTMTLNANTNIKIVGVVVRHLRLLTPPGK
jgi:transcriptional regulator with XRE-family HTH domain